MRTELNACLVRLNLALEHFPFEVKRAYADWLAQTFYYVRHSTRLLAAAAARFPQDALGDALHLRFAKHMAEEKKHELLCVHDVKALGLSIAELPEHASTRMFYETQYFKVEHKHPTALLGYILPLEAIAVTGGPAHLARVKAAYPTTKCWSFVHVHAEEDPDHLEKAFQAIESLPPELHPAILENLLQSTDAYINMLAEIRQKNA